jgi:hypothetical protein
MKVKGWAVVDKITEEIKLTILTEPKRVCHTGEEYVVGEYEAFEGRIDINGSYSVVYAFDCARFKVKPCTITIHDKAVGK